MFKIFYWLQKFSEYSIGDEGAKELGQELKEMNNLNSLKIDLKYKKRFFWGCNINNEKNKAKKFLLKSFV